MGRPSSYTDEIADAICEAIATGAALHALCRQEGMPSEATVYFWLEGKGAPPEFLEKYKRARARQQDYEADHIIEIADTEEDPNKARVMIDARKWRASKLAPKKYGERIEQHIDGELRFIARLPEPVGSMEDWEKRYRPLLPNRDEQAEMDASGAARVVPRDAG